MIAYSVNIPENRQIFFQEFLEMIGTKYETLVQKNDFFLSAEQKRILDSQDDIPLSDYALAEDFIKDLRKEYAL
jgi:hypothetical protein